MRSTACMLESEILTKKLTLEKLVIIGSNKKVNSLDSFSLKFQIESLNVS